MKTVNIHEAKTPLSRLVEAVAAGEEVEIAPAGKPVARLVPIMAKGTVRFGALAERLRVPDDFDAPWPNDILASLTDPR